MTILGIDASNLRAGGGITHLCEFLSHMQIESTMFNRVIIWAGDDTLAIIPEFDWLEKHTSRALNGFLARRTFWQQVVLPLELKKSGCRVLFSPGGTLPFFSSVPKVTMCRNMLPFDNVERRRFKKGLFRYKMLLLKWIQAMSFKRADGVIFLTQYAYCKIKHMYKLDGVITSIIPHGVNSRFRMVPRQVFGWETYSWENPLNVLCVSIIDVYKHQWTLVEAVAKLRSEGFPIAVDFVGPANSEALSLFDAAIERHDASGEFVKYHGAVNFGELEEYYGKADVFAFTSSCENLPNILLEAMAAGLPIVCSDRSPMPEVLGDYGEYFNPESAISLQNALLKMIVDNDLRLRYAWGAYNRAADFSWKKCANNTLSFLSKVVSQAS